MGEIGKGFKSGFVGLIGAPNSGKSTFLNCIIGQKISIVSQKPQTTRNRIVGILNREESQIVFIDTPGVHEAKNIINTKMVNTALASISDVDVILFILDGSKSTPEAEQFILKKLEFANKPVILAINKIDILKKQEIFLISSKWEKMYNFKVIIGISAMENKNIDVLIGEIESVLPNSCSYFPKDYVTDMPEKFIAAEIVREKIFRFTGDEIPYSTAVSIDLFSEEENITKIYATIHVERNSQKGIIIGKQGAKIKQIGQEARKEIENMVQNKVFLKLFVRVQENWTKDEKVLKKFGY